MIQLLVYAKGRRQDKYKYCGMHVQAYMCRTHIRNVLGIPQKYMANIGQVEKGIRTKHPSAGMADEKNQGWSDEEWQQWWDGWNENWQHAWEEWQYYAGAAGAKDEPPSAVCNPIWQSMSAEMFGGPDDTGFGPPAAKRRKVELPQGPLAKAAQANPGGASSSW